MGKDDERVETLNIPNLNPNNDNKTYIIASSSKDEQSLFKKYDKYTKFTNELIHLFESGVKTTQAVIEIDNFYDKLSKIVEKKKLPQIEQKNNFKTNFFFCKNSQFINNNEINEVDRLIDRAQWILVNKKKVLSVLEFIEKHPKSEYIIEAEDCLYKLEAEKLWIETIEVGTLSALYQFLKKFNTGQFSELAKQKIQEIKQDLVKKEKKIVKLPIHTKKKSESSTPAEINELEQNEEPYVFISGFISYGIELI